LKNDRGDNAAFNPGVRCRIDDVQARKIVGRLPRGKMIAWPRKTKKPSQKMEAWIEARKRHHLSHAQVHMARELGMNPAKLGKIDNHEQEPWKLPLPQFIEELYFKRFGKTAPDTVLSVEERSRLKKEAGRTAEPACRGQRDNALSVS
jgi:hypothetical protein